MTTEEINVGLASFYINKLYNVILSLFDELDDIPKGEYLDVGDLIYRLGQRREKFRNRFESLKKEIPEELKQLFNI